jgi:uncharacterized protein (DUF58 family)
VLSNTGNIADYASIEFVANKVVEGFITGLHKSPFHGFSVEFAEHRLYNQGESTKHIDWKLYGRTDKLFVKKYEEETNLRCQIVADCSSSMYFPYHNKPSFDNPNKITFVAYAAGVLISLLYRQRDAFGLSLVSDKIDLITEIHSGFAHKQYIFTLLERLLTQYPQNKRTKIDHILHQLADNVHRRSLFVIFTDLFSDFQTDASLIDSLRHLRHCKHDVILFHVFSQKQELLFDYADLPSRFIDLESGEQIRIRPSDVKESYINIMKARLNNLKQACEKIEIDFVPASMSEQGGIFPFNFNQILIPYLLKRSKLH